MVDVDVNVQHTVVIPELKQRVCPESNTVVGNVQTEHVLTMLDVS